MENVTKSSNKMLSDSSILNTGSHKIDETAETAIRGTDGKVFAGGSIVAPRQKTVSDVYGNFFEKVDKTVTSQAPKVGVSNGKITISAPQAFIDSPAAKQLETELQVLKGADLSNPEIVNAINKLNEEIQRNYSEAMIEQATGWTPEEYNDYQYALQTVSGSNPMKSSNKLKWAKDGELVKGDDGKPLEKTPKQWVDYWRETMSTKERANYFLESLKSSNPYERTMALVLGQGNNKAVYGFSPWEQAGQGVAAAWNQLRKLPIGTFRLLATDNHTKRVESLSKDLGIPDEALTDASVSSESQFEDMKKTIEGKSWRQLSDKQKAFVLESGVSEEDIALNDATRDLADALKNPSGYGPISGMSNEDEAVSREAIKKILDEASFDDYKGVRENYATWVGYDKEANKLSEDLEKNAFWSGTAQSLGNIAGTIGRFLWENAIVQGLTGGISGESLANPKLVRGAKAGGISMNAISDKLGAKMVDTLAKHGYSLGSTGGQAILNFTANLVGTIPEDIIQTAVDNVLTYNAEENENLPNLTEMGENFRNNLIWMSIFNMAKAGINSVKRYRAAKKLAKQLDLDTEIAIEGIVSDADDLARAMKEGQEVIVENGKVSIIDENGNEKILKGVSPEQAEMAKASALEADFDVNAKTNIDSDDTARATNDTDRIQVEIDTPNGRATVEAPDYRPRNVDEALEIDVEPTPAGVAHAQKVQLEATMNELPSHLAEFHDKFGDVRVSDFDWVWYKTKQGLSPEQIVGTTDPTTGRTVTQNMIDAMRWWSEQPFTKNLRLASRGELGLEGDFDVLGYLPHTVYDPTNVSLEEALTGRLWETSTGASVLGDDGKYRGFGGTFDSRYRTFASNMLWDSKAEAIATAKLIEEAQMDGRELTPELVEQSKRAVKGEKDIQQKVNDASSTKELVNALSSDSDDIDWKEIDENIKKQAPKSGLGQAYHDNYQDVYMNADTDAVNSQLTVMGSSFDQQSESMKKIIVGNGKSMYDWGGADIVYSSQNAAELIGRYTTEGGDLRSMLVEYIQNHSHRPQRYAESLADKWIARMTEGGGKLTKGKAIYSLGNSMKWEAVTRLKKWLVTADYSKFNSVTKKFIDRFLFDHVQMESIKNNPKIGKKLSKALDSIAGLRYRSLFYGNIKNALLQISELSRLFTTFKWGDVGSTLKRLATDSNFRARVDIYTEAVAPRTNRLDSDLYGKYANVADSAEVTNEGITFRDLGKSAKETADAIGLGAINKAESLKNRAMVAALVQEADRLGLTGDEALRHIRNRFERVALAANEMGKIGLASNRLAKPMLFLQNFQIRELGMHYYNIKDATGMTRSIPKKILNAGKYLTKVLGTKIATTLLLARLGYSANQVLGLDPFGLLDNYNNMDEDDMEWIDKQISGGVLTPFFSGGMTSLIADMYFMARKAFEDSTQQTLSDEAEQKLGPSWGVDMPKDAFSFDSLISGAANFIPGSAFAKRLSQMNEMMDSGWAVSSTGNKMYAAPDDALNTILGYLFGRSATANAQQYNQTYGDNLGQTLGRFNPLRDYNEFDPIDAQNYSDWFKGNENDLQQFNKGLRYFREQKKNILDTYNSVISDSYASSDEVDEAINNMNYRLEELFGQLERFVGAYEKKNGTISPAMVKQVVNVLNTNQNTAVGTSAEREERSLQDYSDALRRYSELGLSPVGTYSGATELSPEKDTKYQGSPQFRTAVSGYYGVADEAVDTLKLADEKLAPVRKALQERLSGAYAISDWGTVEAIQQEYLKQFDQVVAPIIALYGNGILTNTNVANQLRDMLSTGTNKRSGNLIPSSQYSKNKYGRYQSMPYESVDVGDWASQRYRSDVFKNPTSRSYSTAAQDILEIKKLISQKKNDSARAKALQLRARIDNQSRAISQEDYAWLNNYLKGGK